jgi:hypothetical protein
MEQGNRKGIFFLFNLQFFEIEIMGFQIVDVWEMMGASM